MLRATQGAVIKTNYAYLNSQTHAHTYDNSHTHARTYHKHRRADPQTHIASGAHARTQTTINSFFVCDLTNLVRAHASDSSLSLSLSRSPLAPLCARVIADLLDDNVKQDRDERYSGERAQHARCIIILFARHVEKCTCKITWGVNKGRMAEIRKGQRNEE